MKGITKLFNILDNSRCSRIKDGISSGYSVNFSSTFASVENDLPFLTLGT